MASMASSSKPIPSLEERMAELQMELDRVKSQVREQARIMLSLDNVGVRRWEVLNQDFINLRKELTNDTDAQFKDVPNVHGEFGNRLSRLEVKVEKLTGEWPNKPNAPVKKEED